MTVLPAHTIAYVVPVTAVNPRADVAAWASASGPTPAARPLPLLDSGGKTVTRTLTADQARRYEPWFDNARQIRALSAEIETLSLQLATRSEGWGEK